MDEPKQPIQLTEDQLHKNCLICKRPLVSLVSQMLGMGAICARKKGVKRNEPEDPNQLKFQNLEVEDTSRRFKEFTPTGLF